MTDSTSSGTESDGIDPRRFRAVEAWMQRDTDFRGPVSGRKRQEVQEVELIPPLHLGVAHPPASAYLPVQKVVDRHRKSPVELDRTIVRLTAPDPDTGELLTVEFYALGDLGPDPNDPAAFSLSTPFGIAICPTLASYAAARCGLW
jgi:hypothetical protein